MTRHVPGPTWQAGQRGQVLVPGLLLLGVLAALLAMLHGLGRMVEAWARLTHAADAAAYSGALEQARRLNFLAYANRAQVAHQIAMAHLVTLGASMAFTDTLAGQRRRNNPPGNLLATLFGRDVGQAYRAARADPQVQVGLAQAYAEHDRVVHEVLAAASAAAVAGLPAARERLMRAVLQDNYGDGTSAAQPVPRVLRDAWPGYVRRRAATPGIGLWSAVEQAVDRYGFLGRRDGTRRNALPANARCPKSPHVLRRQGSTWLGADGRWGGAGHAVVPFLALESLGGLLLPRIQHGLGRRARTRWQATGRGGICSGSACRFHRAGFLALGEGVDHVGPGYRHTDATSQFLRPGTRAALARKGSAGRLRGDERCRAAALYAGREPAIARGAACTTPQCRDGAWRQRRRGHGDHRHQCRRDLFRKATAAA